MRMLLNIWAGSTRMVPLRKNYHILLPGIILFTILWGTILVDYPHIYFDIGLLQLHQTRESSLICVILFDLLPGENVEAESQSFCHDALKHASRDTQVFLDLLCEVVQNWQVMVLIP